MYISTNQNTINMENEIKTNHLWKWKVTFLRDADSIILSLPFWSVKEAHERAWEIIGKRPRSMTRL